MIETRQPRTERAIETVENEVERTEAERRAFARFLAALREIGPATATTRTAPGGGSVARASVGRGPDDSLRRVRAAYRETVMDVPHFTADYDDTLAENLTVEFGPELATAVVDARTLTPVAHDGLVAGAENARRERERFLDLLRRERQSLGEVRRTLNDVEARAVDIGSGLEEVTASVRLGQLEDRLVSLESECERLSDERQRLLHRRAEPQLSGVGEESLSEFLYGESETRYPALRDVTACLDTIRNYRERCLH